MTKKIKKTAVIRSNKMKFYVYKITNNINGKFYIGKTYDVENRFRKHIYISAGAKNSKNYHYLHKAINKYGHENFTIETIDECLTEKTAFEKEIWWINKLNAKKNGCNLTNGGGGLPQWWWDMLPEERKKVIGFKISAAKMGHKVSQKTIDKLVERNIERARLGLGSGENHPMWGKTHTKDAKKEISKKCRGERNGRAKFTEKEIVKIREEYSRGNISTRKLAKKYRVGKSTIFSIISGVNWSHV